MSTASDLISELDRIGCQLTLDGDSLLCKPLSKVPQALRDQIRDLKPDVIAVVRQRTSSHSPAPSVRSADDTVATASADTLWPDDPFVARPDRPRPEWSPEQAELVDWFRREVGGLSSRPFALRPGVRVADPRRFFDSLERDVEAGPRQARNAGLMIDLAELRQALAKGAA